MMIPCSFRKKVNCFRWGVSEAMVVLHNPKRILILFDSEGGAGSAMSRHSIVLGIASRQHSNLGAHRQVYYIKSNISICKSPDLWLIRVLYIAFRWDEMQMRLDSFFLVGERGLFCVLGLPFIWFIFSLQVPSPAYLLPSPINMNLKGSFTFYTNSSKFIELSNSFYFLLTRRIGCIVHIYI